MFRLYARARPAGRLKTALKELAVNPAEQLRIWGKAVSFKAEKAATLVVLDKSLRTAEFEDLNFISRWGDLDSVSACVL